MTVIIFFGLLHIVFTTILPAQYKADQQTVKLLIYTGKAQDFPIWSTRFVAMMQTKALYKSLLGTEEKPKETASQVSGSSNDEKKNQKVLKDAYEKEVADIKEKRNNVWCHLALKLDATTLSLMRHDFVEDHGIGDGAQAWRLLQERFQSVETTAVATLVAHLVRLPLEDAEDLDSFFIRGQELLTRLQQAGEVVSKTLFNALVLNGLPFGMKVLLYSKTLTRQRTSQSWRKGCRTSMRAQQRGTRAKWLSGNGSEAQFQEETQERKQLCVWDPWTHCQGLQEEGDSTMQQVWWKRTPRHGMQETKRLRQTWVSGNEPKIGFTRQRILGRSYPVENSSHASGQWLYISNSDKHRRVLGLCSNSISG